MTLRDASNIFLGATVGIIGCVLILMFSREACAGELVRVDAQVVQPVAEKVAALLQSQGMQVRGDLLPPVHFLDLTGTGWDGVTMKGRVYINSRAPEGCVNVILGHELSHAFLQRDLGLTETEEVARQIEREVDGWRPNCEAKE